MGLRKSSRLILIKSFFKFPNFPNSVDNVCVIFSDLKYGPFYLIKFKKEFPFLFLFKGVRNGN